MTLGLGLAGAGRRAATVHAPAIARCEQVRFAGVWSRTPAAAQALAGRYQATAYADYDEFVAHCDAVALAVPPAAQPQLAAAAARQGKAVLLEKPIAADLAGAEELARAIDRARVVSLVALTWRFAGPVRQFLDVEAPAVGVVGGNGRLVIPAPAAAAAADNWRIAHSLLRTAGVDLLDLLDAALGPIVGVQAHGRTKGWIGMLFEHRVGRVSEASLYAGAPEAVRRAEVEVFGPGGSARIDLATAGGAAAGAAESMIGSVDASAAQAMIDEFAKAVQAGTPHPLGVDHGLHLQNVIEEAESYLLLSG